MSMDQYHKIQSRGSPAFSLDDNSCRIWLYGKWLEMNSSIYWSGTSSRHFLRFLSNIFKKQSRNLCFTPLLFCMNHNDLPTKWIFIKESARWSGIHYYDVAFFNRKWPQQKQFSPTFRNIVFCEAKASKGKKNNILEN